MIDRTKYLACNMNRLANDHSFTRIESVLEVALLKIESAAKQGKFDCWVYEQDINKKKTLLAEWVVWLQSFESLAMILRLAAIRTISSCMCLGR